MPMDTNKQLVRDFYELFNTNQADRVHHFVSPNYTEVHDGIRHEIGVEGAKAHIHGIQTVFRDFQITIDRQIAEGEWVVSCITASGALVGEWFGIKPTGKQLSFTGVNVDRIVGGRIIEHGGAANLLGPLMQSGLLIPK